MADDIHDELAKALSDIRARLGEGALADRRKVVALLSDGLPRAQREIRLVGIAIDNGAAQAIATAPLDRVEFEIDRYAQRVDADLGIRKAVMVPVLRAVAFAARRGALPSLHAPADASWVGETSAPASSPAAQVQPSPAPVPRAEPKGLGGWLVLWPPALVLLALALGYIAALGVARLVSVLVEASHIVRTGLVVLPTAMAAVAALSVVVLWLHFRRSHRAPLAYGIWLVALGGLPFVADGTRLTEMRDDVMWMPWWLLYPPLVVTAVGLGYFFRSRRVRNTFVR
jgi:hypothetical protein